MPPQQAEVAFEGLVPWERTGLREFRLEKPFSTTFQGRAFVIEGRMVDDKGEARCEVKVDGRLVETVTLKGDYHDRRTPLFWNYDLEKGSHTLEITRVAGDGLPRLDSFLTYQ